MFRGAEERSIDDVDVFSISTALILDREESSVSRLVPPRAPVSFSVVRLLTAESAESISLEKVVLETARVVRFDSPANGELLPVLCVTLLKLQFSKVTVSSAVQPWNIL